MGETEYTNNVEHERDEPVVGSQGKQNSVHKQNVLEVIDDTLAIQEVHGRPQEVPVQRLGEAQAASLARHISYRNDLLEADDLDGCDDDDNIEMASAKSEEEATDHDESPYCAHDEVCLLFLVFALFCCLWCLEMSVGRLPLKANEHTGGSTAPLRVGVPGCEPVSLISDTLIEARRARPLLALRCANLTSLRGRAIISLILCYAEVPAGPGRIEAAVEARRRGLEE